MGILSLAILAREEVGVQKGTRHWLLIEKPKPTRQLNKSNIPMILFHSAQLSSSHLDPYRKVVSGTCGI